MDLGPLRKGYRGDEEVRGGEGVSGTSARGSPDPHGAPLPAGLRGAAPVLPAPHRAVRGLVHGGGAVPGGGGGQRHVPGHVQRVRAGGAGWGGVRTAPPGFNRPPPPPPQGREAVGPHGAAEGLRARRVSFLHQLREPQREGVGERRLRGPSRSRSRSCGAADGSLPYPPPPRFRMPTPSLLLSSIGSPSTDRCVRGGGARTAPPPPPPPSGSVGFWGSFGLSG